MACMKMLSLALLAGAKYEPQPDPLDEEVALRGYLLEGRHDVGIELRAGALAQLFQRSRGTHRDAVGAL